MKRNFYRLICSVAGAAALAGAMILPVQAASSTSVQAQAHTLPTPVKASRISDFSLDQVVLLPGVSYGPADNSLYRLGEIGNEFGLIDGVGLYTGLNIDVASVIDSYARDTFGGLFAFSPGLTSPYLTEASGGVYSGLRVMLADGLRFNFGQAFSRAGRNPYLLSGRGNWAGLTDFDAPFDRRSTDTMLAGLSWNFTKWGGISFTAAQVNERGVSPLGNAEALNRSRLMTLGVSAHVSFGSGWVTTFTYNQASSQLSLNPVAGEGAARSQSYGIAVAKQGLFGHDALGVSLSRPAGTYTPNIGNDMQFQFYGRDKLGVGAVAETDLELGYVTTFLDGPLALQANAAYQMNYNGQNRDALTLMSRAKIKF